MVQLKVEQKKMIDCPACEYPVNIKFRGRVCPSCGFAWTEEEDDESWSEIYGYKSRREEGE